MMNNLNKRVTKEQRIHLILIALIVVIATLIFIVNKNKDYSNDPMLSFVDRAFVSKSISLIEATKNDCEKSKDQFDLEEELWFEKYMNYMYQENFFDIEKIKPTQKEALKKFSYEELDELLKRQNVSNTKIEEIIKENKPYDKITYKQWSLIYELLIKSISSARELKLEKQTIIIVDYKTINEIKESNIITSVDKNYVSEGIDFSFYKDKKVEVYINDNEIVLISKKVSDTVEYNNVWIKKAGKGIFEVVINNTIKKIEYKNDLKSYTGVVADIKIENHEVLDIKIKENIICKKLLSISSSTLELEEVGDLLVSKHLVVYKNFEKLEKLSIEDIIIGYTNYDFVIENEEVVAIIMKNNIDYSKIRILIKNIGYIDYLHEKITISSKSPLVVKYKNDTSQKEYILKDIKENEKFTLTEESEFLKGKRVIIEAQNAPITIHTLLRDNKVPAYRGRLEVFLNEDGLMIVNEVDVEEYLYSVVANEMPFSYSKEALKTQAIVARTFAYNHIKLSKLKELSAHVDDTSIYQPYNEKNEHENTIIAVDETKNLIITNESKLITPYFFSTSIGATTDYSIWTDKEIPYIKSKFLQKKSNKNLDLKDEDSFEIFIKSSFDSLEASYPYYRWNVFLPIEKINKDINSILKKEYEKDNKSIETLKGEEYVNEPINDIGNISEIKISSRKNGGSVYSITIYGSKKTVRVNKEEVIRKVLAPRGEVVTRNDLALNNSLEMLPSAFFMIENIITNKKNTGIKIYGGGYGHGVGLSQNAAEELAKEGSDYEEIIKFFYEKVEVVEFLH